MTWIAGVASTAFCMQHWQRPEVLDVNLHMHHLVSEMQQQNPFSRNGSVLRFVDIKESNGVKCLLYFSGIQALWIDRSLKLTGLSTTTHTCC